jgi:hypothetical protein
MAGLAAMTTGFVSMLPGAVRSAEMAAPAAAPASR